MVIPVMMPSVQGVRETGAKGNDGDSRDDAFSPITQLNKLPS